LQPERLALLPDLAEVQRAHQLTLVQEADALLHQSLRVHVVHAGGERFQILEGAPVVNVRELLRRGERAQQAFLPLAPFLVPLVAGVLLVAALVLLVGF
jgi:hypothetical protein